jgi:hypothetical protein
MAGPRQLTVYGLEQGMMLRVYRIVRAGVADDPVMLDSFRSHFALGAEPRRVERQSAVLHMGIGLHRCTGRSWDGQAIPEAGQLHSSRGSDAEVVRFVVELRRRS